MWSCKANGIYTALQSSRDQTQNPPVGRCDRFGVLAMFLELFCAVEPNRHFSATPPLLVGTSKSTPDRTFGIENHAHGRRMTTLLFLSFFGRPTLLSCHLREVQ